MLLSFNKTSTKFHLFFFTCKWNQIHKAHALWLQETAQDVLILFMFSLTLIYIYHLFLIKKKKDVLNTSLSLHWCGHFPQHLIQREIIIYRASKGSCLPRNRSYIVIHIMYDVLYINFTSLGSLSTCVCNKWSHHRVLGCNNIRPRMKEFKHHPHQNHDQKWGKSSLIATHIYL